MGRCLPIAALRCCQCRRPLEECDAYVPERSLGYLRRNGSTPAFVHCVECVRTPDGRSFLALPVAREAVRISRANGCTPEAARALVLTSPDRFPAFC